MSAPSPAALLSAQVDCDWPDEEIAAYDSRPALVLVPDPPRRRSLADYVSRVDYIADTIEGLDDDDLDEETRDTLSQELIAELAGTRAKVDSVASVLAMFEHLESAADAEADRLAKRAAFYGRQRGRLEKYVLAVLEASQLERIEGETSTLLKRANPARVVIDDPRALPEDWLRTPEPPQPQPDKRKIGAALKRKQHVPGCRLEASCRLERR